MKNKEINDVDSVYLRLKNRQRAERECYDVNVTVRIHRALSWLQRAEMCTKDSDAQVIFLWIAFNAAYAYEIHTKETLSSQDRFNAFIEKICDLDSKRHLEKIVWQEFAGSIRILLDNKHVFQPFWDYQNGKIVESVWEDLFLKAKATARDALGKNNTAKVLAIVFSRIYTLRNQLVHGGATWNSSVNRDQIRDCAKILNSLVPFIIEIMMDNPHALWGKPCYPVVE